MIHTRRLTILLFLITTVMGVTSGAVAQTNARARYSFNSRWKLFVGDVAGAEQGDFNDADVGRRSFLNLRASVWIKYEFAQPARVSEVTLKLAGWRTRSYPIRISVDDRVAFRRDSAQSRLCDARLSASDRAA